MTRQTFKSYARSTSRALLFDDDFRVYLVTHDYTNPENQGKWSTIGGLRDPEDASDLACLKRELSEELTFEAAAAIEIGPKLDTFVRECVVEGKDLVAYHFYKCRISSEFGFGKHHHASELLDGRFFDFSEVEEIEKAGQFILGCEANFIRDVLKKSGRV